MKNIIKQEKPILEYFNDFLDWLEIEKGLGSKTQENYGRFLKRFFDWLKTNNLESIKPSELKKEHILAYRLFLARQYLNKTRKPLKKSTQNYYLIALRAFLAFLAERDINSLSPEKVKLAKDKKEKEVRFLNLEQVERLLSAPNIYTVHGLRDRAILESLFSTGMRISELISLNKEQFKLKSEIKELEISIIGKGGKIRPVYFSERALFWLKKYLQTRQDKEKALFINYKSKKGALRRLTARYVEKMIKRYCILAGLPLTTTPHVLRHTFATDLLRQGVDLRTIQEFLGHKNIAATQIYTHVTSQQLREVHRRFHSGSKLKK